MSNFQGDITKTRDLLTQAVQYLDHVTNTHGNGSGQSTSSGTSAAMSSGNNTHQFLGTSSEDRSRSIGGRSFVNRGTPYPSADRRALFRPNHHVRPAFNPSRPLKKRGKIALWRHNFLCLAYTSDDLVPSNMAKANLIRAGLGLKEITFALHGGSSDFHEEIIKAFPKLKNGGGYELLRTSDGNNRLLLVIPPLPGGYTASYLKSIMAQSKVYIRPLQQDLSMEPDKSDEDEVCMHYD